MEDETLKFSTSHGFIEIKIYKFLRKKSMKDIKKLIEEAFANAGQNVRLINILKMHLENFVNETEKEWKQKSEEYIKVMHECESMRQLSPPQLWKVLTEGRKKRLMTEIKRTYGMYRKAMKIFIYFNNIQKIF